MRVLLVVHGFPPWASGGTELYTHDFARALVAAGDEVFVLTREARADRPEYEVRTEEREGVHLTIVNNTFKAVRSFEESYRNPAIGAIARDVIARVEPDVAHVHHLTCLSTEIVPELAAQDVPVVMTLNDYWLMCHRGQLLDLDYQRCTGPHPDACNRCVGAVGGASPTSFRAAQAVDALARTFPRGARLLRGGAAAIHRSLAPATDSGAASRVRTAHMRAIANDVSLFLAPSNTLRSVFLEFGFPEARLAAQPQGIPTHGFRPRDPAPSTSPLRLAFMGSLMVSKGPDVLLRAFANLPQGRASLCVFGAHAGYHGDDSYRARLQPLFDTPGVELRGPIPHDAVPAMLADTDVLIVPSIWIENAPFVIREAFAAGVPVVASNIGGMAEMVLDGRNGLLFEVGDADSLSKCLARLIDEPDLLPHLRTGIATPRTIEQDVEDTRARYRELVASSRRNRLRRSGPRVGAVVVSFNTPEETELAVRAIRASDAPVAHIIVVDNGSTVAPFDPVRADRLGVTLISNPVNLGFSGGANLGIRRALESGADQVLLVNSDAIVAPDAVNEMHDVLVAHPDVGLVGPLLLSQTHPHTIASAGIAFSTVTGRMRHHDVGQSVDDAAPFSWRIVDAVSGCVMLIRRDVLDRVGAFDERYFFSFEDIEFCLRAREAGFRSAIAGRARAYHFGGRSIGPRSPRALYFATRNHLLLSRTRCAGGVQRSARAVTIVGLNLAFAVTRSGITPHRATASVLRGMWDAARNRYGAD